MDLGLEGLVYVVTGGARGLGRATAGVLVAEGARVVLSGRSQDDLDRAVVELGPNAVAVVADNAASDTADRLVAAARSSWGRVDGALVSVGGPPAGSVMETTDQAWTDAFASIFVGGLRVARTVAEAIEGDGSIAFVLSSSVRQPIAGLAVSNGLRPGLAMAAKTLADELGPRGIRVNGLLPGRIETERTRHLDGLAADPEAARAQAERQIPLRRYGRPAEFGTAAAFLLSPAASYLTGTMLAVDGGLIRAL